MKLREINSIEYGQKMIPIQGAKVSPKAKQNFNCQSFRYVFYLLNRYFKYRSRRKTKVYQHRNDRKRKKHILGK